MLRILPALVLLVVVGAGCNKTPTSPSQSVANTPAVVVAPPPPPSTPYAGVWRGNYIVERCGGTGSLEDIFCSARSGSRPGGVFPVGTSLPISMDLSQSGSSVSGRVCFGSVCGPLSGVVSSGLLTLQGTASGGSISLRITWWSTRASGNVMDGYVSYEALYTNLPGFATVSTRLEGVRK
jgi:hypothetical protein